jgi:uncharacterized protein YkwD
MSYAVYSAVSENIANDFNLELAEYSLMASAAHRSNILSAEWTKVGFGISKLKDGTYVFVQIFS